ncbi:hypothetical protein FRC06_008994, partial [Ceratobasidium sp. 370]
MLILLTRKRGIMSILSQFLEERSATPVFAFAKEKLEVERRAVGAGDPEEAGVPRLGNRLNKLKPQLSRQLFGEESVYPETDDIWDAYAPVVDCLTWRYWQTSSRALRRLIDTSEQVLQNFEEALAEAERRPTVANLHSAAKRMSRWKDVAIGTCRAKPDEFLQTEQRLNDLWKELGWSRNQDGAITRAKGQKSALATPAEMEQAFKHYLEEFFPDDVGCGSGLFLGELEERDQQEADGEETLSREMEGEDWKHDIGVDEYSSMGPEDMERLLGLGETGQFPFAPPPSEAADGSPAPPLKPRWHQLVGCGKMLSGFFTQEPGGEPQPTMLCDEVGVGKTLQIIGVISMLAHIIELQRAGKKLPPLLEEANLKYFAGKEVIESLPILIAVPCTLSSQWVAELKKFTQTGAFNILLYSRNTAGTFFTKDSDFNRACAMKDKNGNSIAHRTIIVAEVTALGREAKLSMTRHAREPQRVAKGTPEELCDPSVPSILGLQLLLTIIDEGHLLRNPQDMYQAVLRISCNSLVRVGATATPVFTGAKDPIALGRLLRYPPVIGEAGIVLAERMQGSERRRRREWADDDIKERFAFEVLKVRSAVHGGKEGSVGKDNLASARAVVEDDKFMKNFYVSKEAIAMSKEVVFPIIVRRTKKSKQPDGQRIMSLQPSTDSVVWVNMTAGEMAAIDAIGAKFQGD